MKTATHEKFTVETLNGTQWTPVLDFWRYAAAETLYRSLKTLHPTTRYRIGVTTSAQPEWATGMVRCVCSHCATR